MLVYECSKTIENSEIIQFTIVCKYMFLSYQCFTTVEVINELVIDALEHRVDNPSIM